MLILYIYERIILTGVDIARIHRYLCAVQSNGAIQLGDSMQFSSTMRYSLSDCYVGGAPRCHRRNELSRGIDLNRRIEYKL